MPNQCIPNRWFCGPIRWRPNRWRPVMAELRAIMHRRHPASHRRRPRHPDAPVSDLTSPATTTLGTGHTRCDTTKLQTAYSYGDRQNLNIWLHERTVPMSLPRYFSRARISIHNPTSDASATEWPGVEVRIGPGPTCPRSRPTILAHATPPPALRALIVWAGPDFETKLNLGHHFLAGSNFGPAQ